MVEAAAPSINGPAQMQQLPELEQHDQDISEGLQRLDEVVRAKVLALVTPIQELAAHSIHDTIAELPPGLFADQTKSLRVLKLHAVNCLIF